MVEMQLRMSCTLMMDGASSALLCSANAGLKILMSLSFSLRMARIRASRMLRDARLLVLLRRLSPQSISLSSAESMDVSSGDDSLMLYRLARLRDDRDLRDDVGGVLSRYAESSALSTPLTLSVCCRG